MPFTAKAIVTDQQVYDLLVTAREGGSNYWVESYTGTKPKEPFTPLDGEVYKFADYPLNGGTIIIRHNDDELAQLTKDSLQRGLDVMSEKYPRHMADLLNDKMYADTADVFLQCCVFGELVYG